MPNILPTDIISGYASDGTNITIPIASLTSLSAAEADAATGDGREVVRAIFEHVTSNYIALADNAKPAEMILSKSNAQAQGANGVRLGYNATFDAEIDPAALTLVAEV